jgi:vitamin B12 transporter
MLSLFILFFLQTALADLAPIPELNSGPARVEYPPGVEVRSSNDFGPVGNTNLESVLQSVPGITVNRQGGVGQTTSIFIRGANSDGTLFLIDGLPINDPSNANKSFDFSSINLNNIDHIEVWKGPQSVIFGSGATGGVINLVTKKGQGPLQLETHFEEGSFNTTSLSQYARGSSGAWSYSLAAAGFITDGISAADAGEERDGSSAADFSTRIGWQPSASSEIEFIGRLTDKFTDLDFAPSDNLPNFIEVDAPNYTSTSHLLTLALKGRQTWNAKLESKWMISRFAQDREYDNNPDASNISKLRAHYTGETYHVENTNRWSPATGWQIYFGPNADFESAASEWISSSSTALANRQTTWLAGVMARMQFDSRSIFLTMGAREDHHSVFGDQSVFEISQGVHITPSLDIFVRAATAYKAPTLYELYVPVFGNPNLQPEHELGNELSIVQYFRDRKIKLEATYFRDQFQNLIQFSTSYSNVGSAFVDGFDVAADFQLKPVHLMFGYTYLETLNVASNQSLLRRPRNSLSAKLRLDLSERWKTDWQYLTVDHRLDSDPATNQGLVMAGYQVWNASVSYLPTHAWKFYLRGENLFDLHYQDVAGYGANPFSIFTGFVYSFSR